MYVGQHTHKNSMNQINEKLIRLILNSIQDYFFESSNSSVEAEAPFISLDEKLFSKDDYILKMSLIGKHKGFVLLSFSSEMMTDFVKENAHESVLFDNESTIKQLCQYKIHKMSQAIRKKLMKSLGNETFVNVAIASSFKETVIDLKAVTILLNWRKHQFKCQFYI